jgi:hypothetical protein
VPFYRREWMTGWVAACPAHRSVLQERCSKCRMAFDVLTLSYWRAFEPRRCPRCGEWLAAHPARPAHPLALALQEKLVAARLRGSWTLPAGREINWSSALTLFSVLLSLVWIDARWRRRARLIERVNSALGGSVLSASGSNYDGLLALSWILKSWPEHLRRLVETEQHTLEQLLSAQSRVPDGDRRRELILSVVAPVWPTKVPEPQCPEPRRWSPSGGFGALACGTIHRELIHNLRRNGATREEARDLVQEAFVRLARGRWPVRDVASFMRMTAWNLWIDEVRKCAAREGCRTTVEALYGTTTRLETPRGS